MDFKGITEYSKVFRRKSWPHKAFSLVRRSLADQRKLVFDFQLAAVTFRPKLPSIGLVIFNFYHFSPDFSLANWEFCDCAYVCLI